MTYTFHPEAEREFIRAIDYYEERQQELGYEFSLEVLRPFNAFLPFLNYDRSSTRKSGARWLKDIPTVFYTIMMK